MEKTLNSNFLGDIQLLKGADHHHQVHQVHVKETQLVITFDRRKSDNWTIALRRCVCCGYYGGDTTPI